MEQSAYKQVPRLYGRGIFSGWRVLAAKDGWKWADSAQVQQMLAAIELDVYGI